MTKSLESKAWLSGYMSLVTIVGSRLPVLKVQSRLQLLSYCPNLKEYICQAYIVMIDNK